MESPLVSCIVPVFNGELYLAETLDSILAQTHSPLDVILVDDGSADGIIDELEYQAWLDDQNAAGLATYYENEWILNIADLVVTDQNISNDGVKLLKLRFYPVATTLYE